MRIWETVFLTSENVMVHSFPDSKIRVETSFETGEIKVLEDGKLKERHQGTFPLAEYEMLLENIASTATGINV